MTLGDKQRLFAELVAKLIIEIHIRGYRCTFGRAYQDPAWTVGHKKSLHMSRLAIDLNLFLDGVYLADTADHELFGVWWERQHKLCRWGGRFTNTPDGNHYSIEHGGMK